MAISNCLFSPTSENPRGFSVSCVLAKLSAKPRNYSQPRTLQPIKNEMTEKKEIKVKKSLLTLILKSIALSILTLFIIQHFGNIRGGDLFAYPKSYIFENPINNTEYSCYWSDGHPPSNYGQSSINNSRRKQKKPCKKYYCS